VSTEETATTLPSDLTGLGPSDMLLVVSGQLDVLLLARRLSNLRRSS
jgi:hypothetical protein